MPEITGILLDTKTNIVRRAVLDGTLEGYYNVLECRCFDIASRTIGGKRYDVYCNDEGLFAEDPVVTAVSPRGEPMLVGNLFICLHDDGGNTVSLTEKDIERILQEVRIVLARDCRIYSVLVMDY